jgi:pimeloyl-ACP methyl ester carboxylesterase
VKLLRASLFVAVLACLSFGCVLAHEYRRPCSSSAATQSCGSSFLEELKGREFDPAKAADTNEAEKRWPYRLAFVEFDDRGEMFDRKQLEQAVDAITNAKRDAQSLGRPPIVAVFVHGWKNNAADSSGNVWGFRQTLAGLAEQFGRPHQPEDLKIPVVGIYIGWRGAVTSLPIVEELTFWDRHAKSENLPSAHMVEVLLKILQTAKGPQYDDPGTISVLVGHSFGGAVLETALTQTIEGMVLGQPLRSPADLTIFLNEAQEATRSYQLIDSMMANATEQDHCHAKLVVNGQRRFENPMIISVSSTGDYATRAFFPFGQLLLRPFNSLRTYDTPNPLGVGSQRPMFFNTTAHMKEFQSHLVEVIREGAAGQTRDPEFARALADGCVPYLDYPDPTVSDIRYQIIEKPGSKNRTPYWVMQIPPAIVPDHSTIFTRDFRAFLVGLICAHTGACLPH